MNEENVGSYKMVNFVKEIETRITKKNIEMNFLKIEKKVPDNIEKIEEVFENYISEKDLQVMKTEIPDKRIFLMKK